MDTVTSWLWSDGTAEAQAAFYTGLIPGSRIVEVWRTPVDTPSAAKGEVLTVEIELAGRSYALLNGGPGYPPTMAASIQVLCDDQAEVDRLWDGFVADGGRESRCGWLCDRWGVPWQITPRRLVALLRDPDPGRAQRAMRAMMGMVRLDIAALDAAADGNGDGNWDGA